VHKNRKERYGELEAFNRLVLVHQEDVFQYTAWMLADGEAAEEVTRQTFLQAYRQPGALANGDAGCYLLRIANQLCRDRLYPASRRGAEGLDRRDPTGCLGALPSALRAVLILVDLQGLDYAQAASVLEIPLAQVRSSLAMARVRVGEKLIGKAISE
jgi:RNA polymerase sigma-70 factor (ECF subfamily)